MGTWKAGRGAEVQAPLQPAACAPCFLGSIPCGLPCLLHHRCCLWFTSEQIFFSSPKRKPVKLERKPLQVAGAGGGAHRTPLTPARVLRLRAPRKTLGERQPLLVPKQGPPGLGGCPGSGPHRGQGGLKPARQSGLVRDPGSPGEQPNCHLLPHPPKPPLPLRALAPGSRSCLPIPVPRQRPQTQTPT